MSLYHNFYGTELEKLEHTSKNKVKSFHENIVVIEEEWFADINLTDGETFPKALIKRAKYRFNQKIKSSRDTKRRIREISINNG